MNNTNNNYYNPMKRTYRNDMPQAQKDKIAQANTGNYTFNIYAQPGQDAEEIAREVEKVFVRKANQRKAAFA